MSTSNGTAAKKSAGTETGSNATDLLRKYADLMRAAGSTDGAWNPDPDEHIIGMLRHDVELSANESKFVALVKLCCLRQKPFSPDVDDFGRGRTLWGWTETGKPLRLAEVMSFFHWDKGNAHKYSRRPLAYGFIRKNADGQFGIGARVQGKFVENPETDQLTPEEDEVVCTDNLPKYLAVEIERFSKPDRLNFLRGWRQIRAASQQRLNTYKQHNYQREQNELSVHCRGFQLELKRKSESGAEEREVENTELSVQTTSVQNGDKPLDNASNGSVQQVHIRKQSKAQPVYEQSSSSSSEPSSVQRTTTTNANLPKKEDHEAVDQISAAIQAHRDTPDPGFVLNVFREARSKDPLVTAEEIVQIIHERAPAKRAPGLEFYRVAVLNCLPLRRVMSAAEPATATMSDEEHLKVLELLIAESPNHPQLGEWRQQLAELREQFGTQAKKAGGR